MLLPLAIIGCSSAPAAQATPPQAMETDTPAPTFTPLPSPTITPTRNPIDFDLTGDWFFLTVNETRPVPGKLVQTGDLLSGTITPSNSNEIVTFEGRYNLATLAFEGTWSARIGGKGTFTFKLHGSANELVGMTSSNAPFCAARDKSALPNRCDW